MIQHGVYTLSIPAFSEPQPGTLLNPPPMHSTNTYKPQTEYFVYSLLTLYRLLFSYKIPGD
jgi:hypothetical protein